MPALCTLPFIVAAIAAPVTIVRAWHRYGGAVRAVLSKEL